MASAQQKPKASGDKRNPNRRNGKVFSKNADKQPKFSGNSIMGYKRSRVEAWAKAADMSVTMYVDAMKMRRKNRVKTKKPKPILVP